MFLILFVAVSCVVTTYLYLWWNKRQKRQIELLAVVARKREDREESIRFAKESASKLDEETRKKIENLTYLQLKEQLQNGQISCVDVLRTFHHKAVKAHLKTNAVCMFVKEAEKWAQEWDEKAKQPGFKKPSLFGIPISLKECVPLEGYDQTRGFVQDTYRPTEEDSVLVQQLKMLGAIPFCQTNVPQSLLSFMCSNPIYGTTTHIMDKTRTSGGSSGGESALISADGSVIGIGGDVGGSVRIPCAYSGLAGIKPSHLRFSHRGVCGSVPGRPLINSNDGPMTKDIETTVDFLRSVWSDNWTSEQDPYVPPVTWNEQLYSSKQPLRIGYYVDDGWFTPTPVCQRAVLEAKQILEEAGHTLVPFKVPRMGETFVILFRAICVDAGKYLSKKLMNDIIEPYFYSQVVMWLVPVWIQRKLSHIANIFFPRLGKLMGALTLSTEELREAYAGIESYRDEFSKLMLNLKLDALLCPATVSPALPHAAPAKLVSSASYTAIFNLLDYGAGVVQVTTVTKEDEERLEKEYNESDPWYRLVKSSSKGTKGLPIAVQIATPPYREEVCLRLLKEIEHAVKSH